MKLTFANLAALSALAVGGGLLAVRAVADEPAVAADAKAPNFSAKGSDGKTHTLASLTKDGPIVLYFISSSCPTNAEAVKYYNRVGTAYGSKVRMVGVINEDAAGYKTWAKEFKPTYPVLYDKDMKIIRAYKAEASPWAVSVANGEIAKTWDGYSTSYLTELNASVAKAGKVATKKIDLKGTPSDPAFG